MEAGNTNTVFFDYKVDQNEGYIFLRVPFQAVDGELDRRGVIVELGKPFLLSHTFQRGNDPDSANDVVSATIGAPLNQFSEPANKDDEIEPKYMKVAQSLIRELELTILY